MKTGLISPTILFGGISPDIEEIVDTEGFVLLLLVSQLSVSFDSASKLFELFGPIVRDDNRIFRNGKVNLKLFTLMVGKLCPCFFSKGYFSM